MKKIFIIIGLILAAFVVLLVGTHVYQSSAGATCQGCVPFTGAAVREGGNLLWVVRHVPCAPAACNPCGAYADSIRTVNISITPDHGRQFFIEQPVTIHETVTVPGVLANISSAQVSVSITYAGWKTQSCHFTVADTRI